MQQPQKGFIGLREEKKDFLEYKRIILSLASILQLSGFIRRPTGICSQDTDYRIRATMNFSHFTVYLPTPKMKDFKWMELPVQISGSNTISAFFRLHFVHTNCFWLSIPYPPQAPPDWMGCFPSGKNPI